MSLELLSIDLSNFCSKQCSFCYNHSHREGNTLWSPEEVISFTSDCIEYGIKAVSLGGGEPFEYEGIFDIIDFLYSKCYLSVTTNGLPLEDEKVWKKLIEHAPDKIHVTIHQPQNLQEVERVENLIRRLSTTRIKPGMNLLVGADKIDAAKTVYARMLNILDPDQIIVIPQRFSNTPLAKDLSRIADGKPFQSPSCLLSCSRPSRFASVSWDKKVNSCSYADGKEPLLSLDYSGLISALNTVRWKSCKY